MSFILLVWDKNISSDFNKSSERLTTTLNTDLNWVQSPSGGQRLQLSQAGASSTQFLCAGAL